MLTYRQQPWSSGIYVHQTKYPTYYTMSSDEYTNSDMRYKFKLYTTDGLVSTTKNPPYINNGTGVYNPNIYLENLLTGDFDPTIQYWKSCPNSIINYRVDIDEFYSGAVQNSGSYTTCIGINAVDENFDENWTDYIMGGTGGSTQGKFLNKFENSTRKVDLTNEYGTLRFLSGNFNPSGLTNYNSLVYEMTISVVKPSQPGYINYYRYAYPNPFWTQTTQTNQLSSTNILSKTKMGKQLIEFPCSAKQINAMGGWNLVGATTPSGYVGYTPPFNPLYNLVLREDDTYTIQCYQWPKGINGRTSVEATFKVESECDVNTAQLHWKNSLGGYDFFRFEGAINKKINVESSNYRKVRDEFGSADYQYNMTHTDYARGETTFHQNIETSYDLSTGILSDDEILGLEDLWYSKDVYMYLDGKFYPVVLYNIPHDILNQSMEPRSYSFEVRLSNKKYN